MSAVINTNIASLNAQRNLSTSQSAMQTALQRLSSGLRINSSKDDAAGLAISERFTSQINGLNQAVRNANDGVSLAQTGEAALGEITNNLQRIRELAVQSANATNSSSDRDAINLEVQELLAEIDRTATQTSFNGQKILDGSFGNATFQVGANAGDTINLTLNSSTRTSAIGAIATAASTAMGGAATAGSYVTGVIANFDFATVAAVPTDSVASGAYTQAASDVATDAFQVLIDGQVASDRVVGDASAANLQTDIDAFIAASGGAYSKVSGGLATDNLVLRKADGTDMVISTRFSDAEGSAGAAAGTTSNGTFAGAGFVGTHTGGTPADTSANATFAVDGTSITLNTDVTNIAGLIAAVDGALGADYTVAEGATTPGTLAITKVATGVASTAPVITGAAAFSAGGTSTAGADAGGIVIAAGELTLAMGDGEAFELTGTYATASALAEYINANVSGAYATATDAGVLTISSSQAFTVGGTEADTYGFTADTEVTATAGTLVDVSVTSAAGANQTILRIDSALTSVSSLRSTFGAIQNRFESVTTSLTTTSENLSAARSRIQDADFAAETAALTRAQILQQAGTAMLAQANQLPNSVLTLLQG